MTNIRELPRGGYVEVLVLSGYVLPDKDDILGGCCSVEANQRWKVNAEVINNIYPQATTLDAN